MFPAEWRTVGDAVRGTAVRLGVAPERPAVRQLDLRARDRPRLFRNSDRDGYCDACDGRRRKANTMTPLDVVLAEIATLELARDALPSNSHSAALFSLTLYRLEAEADAMRQVALKRAA